MTGRQAEIMRKILASSSASDSGTAAQFLKKFTPANIRRRRRLARMWRQANDITFTYQRIGAPMPYAPREPAGLGEQNAVAPCPPGQHYFPLPEELGCDPEAFPGGPDSRGNCACGQPYSTLLDYTDEKESR